VTPHRRARRLDDRTADAILSGRAVDGEDALSGFVAAARASLPATPPAPSDALAAMLEHGTTPAAATAVQPAARPTARRRLQAAVAIGGALGLVVGAGAANALPGPVQNGVSDVVNWVSPLDMPRDDDGSGPTPLPSRSGEPEPGDDSGSSGPEPGDDGGSSSPEPGDDHSSDG
jgi:hypothetical protein